MSLKLSEQNITSKGLWSPLLVNQCCIMERGCHCAHTSDTPFLSICHLCPLLQSPCGPHWHTCWAKVNPQSLCRSTDLWPWWPSFFSSFLPFLSFPPTSSSVFFPDLLSCSTSDTRIISKIAAVAFWAQQATQFLQAIFVPSQQDARTFLKSQPLPWLLGVNINCGLSIYLRYPKGISDLKGPLWSH